jgi:hypothetical protein
MTTNSGKKLFDDAITGSSAIEFGLLIPFAYSNLKNT